MERKEGTTRYSVFPSLFYADILNREEEKRKTVEKGEASREERIRFSKITFETKTSKEILYIENWKLTTRMQRLLPMAFR